MRTWCTDEVVNLNKEDVRPIEAVPDNLPCLAWLCSLKFPVSSEETLHFDRNKEQSVDFLDPHRDLVTVVSVLEFLHCSDVLFCALLIPCNIFRRNRNDH